MIQKNAHKIRIFIGNIVNLSFLNALCIRFPQIPPSKFCVAAFIYLFCCLPSLSHAVDLAQLLLNARVRDPACAIARAQVVAASARRVQARAGILPVLNATIANDYSQYKAVPLEERHFWTTQWTTQLSQPLFRPANFFALSQAEKLEVQAEAQLAAAESELADRVATAWFKVLNQQEILHAIQRQKEATQQQLVAARRSFDVGAVSIADVREVEAKHSLVLAQEALADSELMLARDTLEQMTDVAIAELDSTIWMKPDLMHQLDTLDRWKLRVQEHNPNILQAKYQLQAARIEISKARSGHLPTIDLVASKNNNSATGGTFTNESLDNNTMQVGLKMAIPLFSGLAATGKVKEAIALQDKALGEHNLASDQVGLSLKQAYFGLRGSLAQIPPLETALAANDIAVKANKRGYQVGMRTNVDVLNAQAQFYQTEKDLAKARTDAWLYYIRLRVLTGEWTEADLNAF